MIDGVKLLRLPPRIYHAYLLCATSSPGSAISSYTVLFDDPAAKRRSMLVRALPGATYDYEAHFHDKGHEECLVLEGDLIMGDLKLRPGDFHLAAKGSTHPAAATRSGCVLYQSIAF